MTISTGSFDSFGIPQGSPNRLDDLADVDTLEAKEGNTIQQRGGRWVPVDGNEVAVQSTQPTDLGVELWVNPDEPEPPPPLDVVTADGRYVSLVGDTMTGTLQMYPGADVAFYGSNVPPTIRMLGIRPVPGATSQGLWALLPDGNPAPLNVLSPSVQSGATPKSYVDGSGGFISVSAGVGSSATTTTHLSVVDEWGMVWGGDVLQSGASLMIMRAGLYECSVNGGASSSGGGTVRALVLGDYDNGSGVPPHAMNINNIGQYATATANTSGLGAIMSATGIWYIPANHRIIVRGRQDSGATLNMTATLIIRSIPGQ